MQEKNRVITTKNGKGKLSLFFGNGERVIPIYAVAPIHVGGCGLISRRCVGLVANDATR